MIEIAFFFAILVKFEASASDLMMLDTGFDRYEHRKSVRLGSPAVLCEGQEQFEAKFHYPPSSPF